MERVGLEADLLGVVRTNRKEIGLVEERVEERVEAVRELLQNDIDHAMKEGMPTDSLAERRFLTLPDSTCV